MKNRLKINIRKQKDRIVEIINTKQTEKNRKLGSIELFNDDSFVNEWKLQYSSSLIDLFHLSSFLFIWFDLSDLWS